MRPGASVRREFMAITALRRLSNRIVTALRRFFARTRSKDERYRDFNGSYFAAFYQ